MIEEVSKEIIEEYISYCDKNKLFSEENSILKFGTRLNVGDKVEFFVRKKKFWDIFRPFDEQTLKIGDLYFDSKYIIQGKPKDKILRIFSNSEIRKKILKNNVYSLSCEYEGKGVVVVYSCCLELKTDYFYYDYSFPFSFAGIKIAPSWIIERIFSLYTLSCFVAKEIARVMAK